MDIKKIAAELVEKIQKDPKILEKFQKEPVKAIEDIIGIDLPDAEIEKLAQLVKAKIDMDKVGSMLGGLGGLFKK